MEGALPGIPPPLGHVGSHIRGLREGSEFPELGAESQISTSGEPSGTKTRVQAGSSCPRPSQSSAPDSLARGGPKLDSKEKPTCSALRLPNANPPVSSGRQAAPDSPGAQIRAQSASREERSPDPWAGLEPFSPRAILSCSARRGRKGDPMLAG